MRFMLNSTAQKRSRPTNQANIDPYPGGDIAGTTKLVRGGAVAPDAPAARDVCVLSPVPAPKLLPLKAEANRARLAGDCAKQRIIINHFKNFIT